MCAGGSGILADLRKYAQTVKDFRDSPAMSRSNLKTQMVSRDWVSRVKVSRVKASRVKASRVRASRVRASRVKVSRVKASRVRASRVREAVRAVVRVMNRRVHKTPQVGRIVVMVLTSPY